MIQSPDRSDSSKYQEVRLVDGHFVVDARTIAAAFRLKPEEVQELMRNDRITTRQEIGMDEDAGRVRLFFFHGDRAFRLTVDQDGNILSRASFDVPGRT